MNTPNPHQNWIDVDGDNTYALDWDLNEDSYVWEIGGFEGRWAQQIWDKFHCYITIFEPQLWAAEQLEKRFFNVNKADIRPYGLWVEDTRANLGSFYTDGASMFSSKDPIETCNFKDYYPQINSCKKIDVGLMNIEGAEYTLLPLIIEDGLISRFENFWCQFHPTHSVDYGFLKIAEGMQKTHTMIWNFYPTAVAWRKK